MMIGRDYLIVQVSPERQQGGDVARAAVGDDLLLLLEDEILVDGRASFGRMHSDGSG